MPTHADPLTTDATVAANAAAYQAYRAQYIRELEERVYLKGEAAGAAVDARSAAGAATDAPPVSNTGGKIGDAGSTGEDLPPAETWIAARLVTKNGKVLEIPGRRGWGGDLAVIDWINFTCGEEAFYPSAPGVKEKGRQHPITDDQVLIEVSFVCERIFGFGITHKREKGHNFYHESYDLGDGYGIVGYGGQRGTVLITLNGQGCAAAKAGWEDRLKMFLSVSDRARITRIDLAYDDYEGVHTVDQAVQWFEDGLFNAGGRHPDCEQRGNWLKPNGKGRTFNVGNRTNGKFGRIYEKGKQLGDPSSSWLRFEVEFKSVDRMIPFDILTRPGEYLAASYPAFVFINQRQERIKTKQKTLETTYERMMGWAKQQFGPFLYVASNVEGSAEAVLAKLIREVIPKRLKLAMPGWEYVDPKDQLHNQNQECSMSREHFDSLAFA